MIPANGRRSLLAALTRRKKDSINMAAGSGVGAGKSGARIKVLGLLIVAASTLCSVRLEADDMANEYVVKAAIALNLARFTEWPGNAWGNNSRFLNLCVLGGKIVQEAFSQMDKKPIGKRELHVIPLDRPNRLEVCNMIYVGELDDNDVNHLLAGISGQPKLSVGEQDGFLEHGGLVNLNAEAGKINIQVNLDAVTRLGIKISSRVLALATIINVQPTGNNQ